MAFALANAGSAASQSRTRIRMIAPMDDVVHDVPMLMALAAMHPDPPQTPHLSFLHLQLGIIKPVNRRSP